MRTIASVGMLWLVQSFFAQPVGAAADVLVGTWTLISVERLGAGSGPWSVPSPRGLLVYDAAGHALEIVTRANRTAHAGSRPTPAEALATFSEYGGFWGNYKVDEKQAKVIYRPVGAVHPNIIGQDLVRSYELKGDRLAVTSLPGEPTARGGTRWVWERVPTLENLSPAYRRLVGFWEPVFTRSVNMTTGAVLSEVRRAPSTIVYTPSGFVGVHFVPLNRKRFAAEMPTADEAQAAINGYISYYGTLTLHPGSLIYHQQMATINPQGQANGSLGRSFEIVGPEIHLKFHPPTFENGQEIRTIVTLKRLSEETEMLPK